MQVGVSQSFKQNPEEAAFAAAGEAAEKLGGDGPDLFVAFSASKFEADKVLKGIRTFASAPVFGCSSAGEVNQKGASTGSISVMAISAPDLDFVIDSKPIEENGASAVEEALEAVKNKAESEISSFVVLTDGLAGDGTVIASAIQSVVRGSVPVVGGVAGDDFSFDETYQYGGDEVLTDSVVVLGVSGDIEASIESGQGWLPIGLPQPVNKSEGTTVYTIGNRPASSLYEDYFEEMAEDLFEETLGRLAVHYPLGVKMKEGEYYLMRSPITVSKDDGSIQLTGSIPEGSEVNLMMGSNNRAVESAKEAAQRIKRGLNGDNPDFVLIFSSASRRRLLGEDLHEEVDAIMGELGGDDVPYLGLYTYGEIAPVKRRERADEPYTVSVEFLNESATIFAVKSGAADD